MSQELSGKVAIVTGGAQGIGRAIVDLFLEEGAKVVVADIDPNAADIVQKLGKNARFKRTDVSKADEVQAVVDFAAAEFGALHIMVNNAGISDGHFCRFLDMHFANFHKVMEINVLGVMHGCQSAARQMAKNGGGSIINMSSISATWSTFGMQIYRSSKAGMNQFSKAIAIDLAEYNIRVNLIAPGHIATGIVGKTLAPDMTPERAARLENSLRDVMMSYQPLKRQGTPRDVANAALYLASDRSAQVTGMSIPVDGGVTVGDPVNHLDQMARARAEAMAS